MRFDIDCRRFNNRGMAKDELNELKKQIKDLTAELAEREQDIVKYREQLVSANTRLETLIGQISQELKLAQAIQNTLIPTEFPNIPGFEFSTKFIPSMVSGGDYFDIFSHESKLRFGIVMASCSGHTLSSLFLSVLLKMSGQMEARKGADPESILKMLHEELSPVLKEGGSIDLFYGLVDRRNYEMTYCQLGNVAGLHQVFPGGEIRPLEATGPAMSERFAGELNSKSFNLNPRDKLVLCTRGIVETRNLEEETFGLLRLSRSVQEGVRKGVHEVRNQVLYDLQKFAAGQSPKRDQTVLVIEVKDRVIKLAKN